MSVIVMLVLLAYLGATAYEARTGYTGALQRAEAQAQTIARALEEHVARAIGEADRALINVAAALQGELGDDTRLNATELLADTGAALADATALLQAEIAKPAAQRDQHREAALVMLQRILSDLSLATPRTAARILSAPAFPTSVQALQAQMLRANAGELQRLSAIVAAQAAAIDTAVWQHFVSLLEHIGRIAHQAQLLADSASRSKGRPLLRPANEAATHRLLNRVTSDLPQIRSLVLMDASGRWTADSGRFPHRDLTSADRAFFRQHRDEPDTGMVVGPIIRPATGSEWLFTLSRRIGEPQDPFDGVLAAAVDATYFASFYQAIGLPTDTTVQITARDGTVLVREPLGKEAVGSRIDGSPLFRDGVARAASGVLHAVDGTSGRHEIIGYRVMATLPLVVSVAIDREVALASWRQDVTRTFVVAILVVAAVIILAAQLAAMIQRQSRSAQALEERERDYRSIYDNAREGLFSTTRDGRILRANDAFLRQFGHASLASARAIQSIGGQVWVDGSQRGHMLAEIDRTGEVRDFVFEAYRQDTGAIVKISMTARLARQPDGSEYVEGYCLDVTDRLREAEELRQARWAAEDANRAKSHFLANMSHELRTPLNAILGFSEVIRDQMFGPGAIDRYAQYGGDIHTSGLHLLSLIDDVLDLSKIEAGRYELRLEPVDIAERIAECVRMVETRARSGALDLRAEVEPELPAIVADERVIRQVLLNLASNAVKFTPPGGAVLIGARREDDQVVVRVADTGIGVAPSDLPYLFEPFRRADSAVKRAVEGSGLGLAITQRFVEMHGGTLELTSTLGSGTTVTARFPLPPARQGAGAPTEPGMQRRDAVAMLPSGGRVPARG